MNSLTRREYLSLLGSAAVCSYTTSFGIELRSRSSSAQAKTLPQTEITVASWMDDWMGRTMAPVGSLHVQRFKDPIYILLKPIGWKPNKGEEALSAVQVPMGFVTDFASIPRLFWSLLRPDGEYTYPAIIHDYLYWTQAISREQADMVFRLAMKDFGVNSTKITAIYNAVRIGGARAWDHNAEQKAKGERRKLIRFPQDPRITWDEWKKVPGVFAR